MPQQGLRAGPGGRARRRPPVHGAPWARGHRVLDLPAAVINVYLEMDIALWPASSPFGQVHVVGPAVGHMGVTRPAVDLGIVEDHAWAGTVRSARNPARSSATMGRRRFLSSSTARTAERANPSGVARNGLDR